jgi:hypothetical protein
MSYKLRKVSHPDPTHFHRIFFAFPLFLGLLFSVRISLSFAANPVRTSAPANQESAPPRQILVPDPSICECLIEPEHDALILRSLDRLYRMDYARAEAGFDSLPEIPARTYFRGLAMVNRFNDLGDTSALFRAEALWEKFDQSKSSDKNFVFYQGLTELQLSYVASLTGRSLRAARLGRKAVSKLRPYTGKAEAEAALALYDYYKAALLKHVDWLPFVSPDRETPLKKLEQFLPKSRYLKEILQTSLIWVYYDGRQYGQGLAIIENFLIRYPKNRLYRQIQADFKFRQGDLPTALDIQKSLNQEYQVLRESFPSPNYIALGYLSSVGNLAKIYASQNQPELLKVQIGIWQAIEYQGAMDWLPASLKREVDSLKTQ